MTNLFTKFSVAFIDHIKKSTSKLCSENGCECKAVSKLSNTYLPVCSRHLRAFLRSARNKVVQRHAGSKIESGLDRTRLLTSPFLVIDLWYKIDGGKKKFFSTPGISGTISRALSQHIYN